MVAPAATGKLFLNLQATYFPIVKTIFLLPERGDSPVVYFLGVRIPRLQDGGTGVLISLMKILAKPLLGSSYVV